MFATSMPSWLMCLCVPCTAVMLGDTTCVPGVGLCRQAHLAPQAFSPSQSWTLGLLALLAVSP